MENRNVCDSSEDKTAWLEQLEGLCKTLGFCIDTISGIIDLDVSEGYEKVEPHSCQDLMDDKIKEAGNRAELVRDSLTTIRNLF